MKGVDNDYIRRYLVVSLNFNIPIVLSYLIIVLKAIRTFFGLTATCEKNYLGFTKVAVWVGERSSNILNS